MSNAATIMLLFCRNFCVLSIDILHNKNDELYKAYHRNITKRDTIIYKKIKNINAEYTIY